MPKEQIFMQYICAACDCIFLDKDVKGRMTPIKGCYCPDCQAKGFKNPEVRPKKKVVDAQLKNLKCYQLTILLEGRKNQSELYKTDKGDTNDTNEQFKSKISNFFT